MVEIKNVVWTPIKPTDEGLLGFASVTFGQLSLNSIAVYVRPNGEYTIAFPKKKLHYGAEVQTFYPIDSETHNAIKAAIIKKIEEFNSGIKS